MLIYSCLHNFETYKNCKGLYSHFTLSLHFRLYTLHCPYRAILKNLKEPYILFTKTRNNPSPKGADLRASFFSSKISFLGYFLGYFLRKTPYRAFCKGFQRRERDSNSRYPFGVHTLSRRASSATRASLQYVSGAFRSKPDCKGSKKIRKSHKTVKILWDFLESYSFTM